MERLTSRDSKGNLCLCNKEVYDNNQDIYNAIAVLEECEDLEEQGLMLKLPCKVGDTVYRIIKEFHTRINKIISGKVYRIALTDIEMQIFIDKWQSKGIYGKTVFLTQAEAEEALRKMNETEGTT